MTGGPINLKSVLSMSQCDLSDTHHGHVYRTVKKKALHRQGFFENISDRWLTDQDHFFNGAEFTAGDDPVNIHTGSQIIGIEFNRMFS